MSCSDCLHPTALDTKVSNNWEEVPKSVFTLNNILAKKTPIESSNKMEDVLQLLCNIYEKKPYKLKFFKCNLYEFHLNIKDTRYNDSACMRIELCNDNGIGKFCLYRYYGSISVNIYSQIKNEIIVLFNKN